MTNSLDKNISTNKLNSKSIKSDTILGNQIVGDKVDGKEILSEKIISTEIVTESVNNINLKNVVNDNYTNLLCKYQITEEQADIINNKIANEEAESDSESDDDNPNLSLKDSLNVNMGIENLNDEKKIYLTNKTIGGILELDNIINSLNTVIGVSNLNSNSNNRSLNVIIGSGNSNDSKSYGGNVIAGNFNSIESGEGSGLNIIFGFSNALKINALSNIILGSYSANNLTKSTQSYNTVTTIPEEGFSFSTEIYNGYNIIIGDNNYNSLDIGLNNICIGRSCCTVNPDIEILNSENRLSQNNLYFGNGILPNAGSTNECIFANDIKNLQNTEVFASSIYGYSGIRHQYPSIPTRCRDSNSFIMGNNINNNYYMPGLISKSNKEAFEKLKPGSLYIDDDFNSIDDYVNSDYNIKIKNIFDLFEEVDESVKVLMQPTLLDINLITIPGYIDFYNIEGDYSNVKKGDTIIHFVFKDTDNNLFSVGNNKDDYKATDYTIEKIYKSKNFTVSYNMNICIVAKSKSDGKIRTFLFADEFQGVEVTAGF